MKIYLKTFLFPQVTVTFALACFALVPQARAVCQQGCDSNLFNAFLGDDALISNTTGTGNTAVGWRSLSLGSTASFNTAVGGGALALNTADNNTAVGAAALLLNTSGVENTAVGSFALLYNDRGFLNTATGSFALLFNTTGANNTAIGGNALSINTTGGSNTAIGTGALGQNTIGSNNIALGSYAGSQITGDNNIDIGNGGEAAESGTIRIGNNIPNTATYIAGISGSTVPTGVAVIVDADGHLGTTTSSARFKEVIKPMDKASEVILALKPVTFRYKKAIDASEIPQFGLVAEDVAKVNSEPSSAR